MLAPPSSHQLLTNLLEKAVTDVSAGVKASCEDQLIFLHAQILLFLFLSFMGGVYTNQWSAGQALSKPVSDLEVAGESWGQLRSWPLSLGMVGSMILKVFSNLNDSMILWCWAHLAILLQGLELV